MSIPHSQSLPPITVHPIIPEDDNDDMLSGDDEPPATEANYEITNGLKAPRPSWFSAYQLANWIDEKKIDLNPDYQRDVVWKDDKQSMLVDSMLRNYPVPPIIFSVQQTPDGLSKRTCIDGKQRLTTIWRFQRGEIPHKDSITKQTFWFCDNGVQYSKRKKVLLPAKYRSAFQEKQFNCIEYDELSDESERDIFTRVQMGVALTPWDKMRVRATPRSSFVRDLVRKFLQDDSPLVRNLKFDVANGNDFRFAAHSFYIIAKWTTSPANSIPAIGGPKTVDSWLATNTAVSEMFKVGINDAFQTFCEVARDPSLASYLRLVKNGPKGTIREDIKFAPVETIIAPILFYRHSDTMSFPQYSKALRGMRDVVRSQEKDIRTNARCAKAMLSYIHTLNPAAVTSDLPTASLPPPIKRERESEDANLLPHPPTSIKKQKLHPEPTPTKHLPSFPAPTQVAPQPHIQGGNQPTNPPPRFGTYTPPQVLTTPYSSTSSAQNSHHIHGHVLSSSSEPPPTPGPPPSSSQRPSSSSNRLPPSSLPPPTSSLPPRPAGSSLPHASWNRDRGLPSFKKRKQSHALPPRPPSRDQHHGRPYHPPYSRPPAGHQRDHGWGGRPGGSSYSGGR